MTQPPTHPARRRDDDQQVLPDVTRDERPDGYDPREEERRSREWYERERPPHHE